MANHNIKIRLNNVRLSFPALFKPEKDPNNPNAELKYAATLLLDKVRDAIQINMIREQMKNVGLMQWPQGLPKAGFYCLKDGNEKTYDGYPGCMYIKAATNRRPAVINRDKSPITEDDNVVYSGCYVNAVIELFTFDVPRAKGISAALSGIQFVQDGEAFGTKFDADSEFDVVEAPASNGHAVEAYNDPNSNQYVPVGDLPF